MIKRHCKILKLQNIVKMIANQLNMLDKWTWETFIIEIQKKNFEINVINIIKIVMTFISY